jgi:nitroreductase
MIPHGAKRLGTAGPPAAVSIEFVYRRHSVRSYEAGRLDERTIRILLETAVHAPTAMHQEPWRFVVVQDRALLDNISDRAKALAVASAADHGNLLKPPGASGDGMRSVLADPRFDIFYGATTLIAICAEITSPFTTADCWLAAENLMLAAAASGLGTCVVGFAVDAMNRPGAKELLQIPANVTVVAPIVVGVPRDRPLPSPRNPPVVLSWHRG